MKALPAIAILGAVALLASGARANRLGAATPAPVGIIPNARAEALSWLGKVASGALDVFDSLDPSLLDGLLETELLSPEQRAVVERLRAR